VCISLQRLSGDPIRISNFIRPTTTLLVFAKMVSLGKLASIAALFPPTVFACIGYTGGLRTATSTKTNSKIITAAADQTFDCGWAKYGCGSGACNDQAEVGGADAVFLLNKDAMLNDLNFRQESGRAYALDNTGICCLCLIFFRCSLRWRLHAQICLV
jgi:hypothetical protein